MPVIRTRSSGQLRIIATKRDIVTKEKLTLCFCAFLWLRLRFCARQRMLRAGIVGLPNVGKSTLFNALTAQSSALAANYPFATIEPNVGVVSVPDERLEPLARLVKTEKIVPATVEFLDIAGLVRGASKGEGLGNQFLANIRETDTVVQVVRCFEDENIVHVEGAVDPLRDIETIQIELALSDLATVERRREKAQKNLKGGDKIARQELDVLDKIQPV